MEDLEGLRDTCLDCRDYSFGGWDWTGDLREVRTMKRLGMFRALNPAATTEVFAVQQDAIVHYTTLYGAVKSMSAFEFFQQFARVAL